jgi:phosphatidylglycerophosphatase A
MTHPKLLWITTFGLGHLRPASGTWGSLPPVFLALALIALGVHPAGVWWLYVIVLTAVLVMFCGACVAQADQAEVRFGKKDPGQVVADETAGQCLPLLALTPAMTADWKVAGLSVLVGFLSFRILDILKPWPARQIQRVPGAWGILLDDLVAGVYAALATHGIMLAFGVKTLGVWG